MQLSITPPLTVVLVILVSLLDALCAADVLQARIHPSLQLLPLGGTQKFLVAVQDRPLEVPEWSVNGIVGGNHQLGRITADGVYTAPASAPENAELSIRATLMGSENRSLWATVVVGRTRIKYRLVNHWGESGTGPGQMVRPHGIAIDSQGNLLVTDRVGSRVQRFTKEGRFLKEIGKGPGNGDGQFLGPSDVELDAAGNIYVAEAGNHRVQVFTGDGDFLRTFGAGGPEAGEQLTPHALAIEDRRLYLADDDNHRVSILDHSGQFLQSWDNDHPGIRAWYKPHSLDTDPNGDVFVCNFYLPCFKLTNEGRLTTVFAPPRPDADLFIIHGLATDRWGNVYTTSRDKSQRDRIMKFNNNGTLIADWSPAEGSRRLECIALDRSGRLFVTVGVGNPGVEVYAPGY